MIIFLKTLHITCAALSFLGFVLRGIWMWRQSPLLQHRFTRILPHAIDTVLLASALALLWLFQFQPWEHPWLLTKIAVLLVYIGTGTIALKRGKTRQQRLIAFIAAIVSFGFITSVAVTKSPLGYLALL